MRRQLNSLNTVTSSFGRTRSKPRQPEAKRAARVSAPLNIYLWEDTTLRVLPHLAAAGEGAGYGPINARRFHTTITEKYYPDLEVSGGSPGDEARL